LLRKNQLVIQHGKKDVRAFPAFPPCYGGMSLLTDNAGFFAAAVPFNTMAMCVPFTAETIWGNIMSSPPALLPYDPASEGSILAFPASYELPADPYDANTCIFRPWFTGIYQFEVSAVLYASYTAEAVDHYFDVHWALVKGETDTIKDITDIGALPSDQLLPLAHHVGLSDSAVPVELHTSQILKISHNEEVALFAYFASEDANTAEIIDAIVMDAPGFSATPAFMQFNRVG